MSTGLPAISTRFHALPTAVRAALGLVLAVAVAVVAAGCGSSEDVTKKSAAEILAASKAAAAKANSARVNSRATQGSLVLTSNLTFSGTDGHAGVSFIGLTFEVMRIGNDLYLKGNKAFFSRLSNGAIKNAPTDKWVKTTATGTQNQQLAGFTNKGSELARLMSSTGPLQKGAVTTVNGQKVIELKETAKLFKGSLFVAATGTPYPIQVRKTGRETGLTNFSSWNQSITLTAPTNTVELSALEHEKH